MIEEARLKILENPPTRAIIILLTESSLTENHGRIMSAGVDDFLITPFSLRWVEKKVIEWSNVQGVIDLSLFKRFESATQRK